MTEPNFMRIILIGPTGRERDNLLALAESLEESIPVQCVDTCHQAEILIPPNLPTLILMDYRHPEERINKEISMLAKNQPNIHIVLLRSRSDPKTGFPNSTFKEVQYGDISVEFLHRLLSCFYTPELQVKD